MVTLADIKKDLPTWPDDVIEQWLLYLADREDTGWPPPNPLGDHSWAHILSDIDCMRDGHRPCGQTRSCALPNSALRART